MKKICFISSNISLSGGTERVSIMLMNELIKKGYDVSVISIFNYEHSFYDIKSSIKQISLNIEVGELKNKYVSVVKKLRKVVKENNFDTIICIESTLSLIMIPATIGINIKKITWEHFNCSVSYGNKARVLARILSSFYSTYVVTLTEIDKKMWQKKYFCRSEIITINNPISRIHYNNQPKLENNYALSIGRLSYQKGFDLLIPIWKKFAHKNPSWILLIAGKGEDYQLLYDLIEKNELSENVKLLGEVKDVDSLYRMSSVYLMTSRFEGLPMVLLEALSYSLPIISFDCLTGPSEVINDGSNGYLIDSFDSDLFVEKLNCLAQMNYEDYQNMIDNAHSSIEKFAISRVIDKWISIL